MNARRSLDGGKVLLGFSKGRCDAPGSVSVRVVDYMDGSVSFASSLTVEVGEGVDFRKAAEGALSFVEMFGLDRIPGWSRTIETTEEDRAGIAAILAGFSDRYTINTVAPAQAGTERHRYRI